MDEAPEPVEEPASLRFLRILVTVLTGTMILGLLILILLFVIRLKPADGPALPEELTLPDGVTARAVTFGSDWMAVVTGDDRILIFDRSSGALRQSLQIEGGN